MKRVLTAVLLGLYPERWRAEYGEELGSLLLRRPLGVREVLNVVKSAAWQQFRLQEPWILLGVPLAFWMLAYFIASAYYDQTVLRPSGSPNVGHVLFFFVGFWTVIRQGRAGGRAAMKFNLLVCSPMLLVGLLALIGAIRIVLVGPGHADVGDEWRLTMRFYDKRHMLPAQAVVTFLTAPIFATPFAGAVGWCGGLAAALVRRWRNSAA